MGLWDGPALAYPPVPVPVPAPGGDSQGASSVPAPGNAKTSPPGAAPLGALAAGASPRARLAAYLWDGIRVVLVTDASGEDDLEVHLEDGAREARRLCIPPAILGRPEELAPSPEAPLVAVVNHRSALLIIDTESGQVRTADTSPESGGIRHLAWSHCGSWLAYTRYVDAELSCVKILDVSTGVTRAATDPVLGDCCPAWDPAGNFLYFLSSRELEPTYDAGKFGLSFHGIYRPHALALRSDVPNPLLRELRPPHDSESDSDTGADDDDSDDGSSSSGSDGSRDKDAPTPVEIEFDGLTERVVALPMPAGKYACLTGLDDGRFMLVKYPVKNAGRVGLDAPYYAESDDEGSDDDEEGSSGALLRFDVRQLKTAYLIDQGVRSVQISLDRRCMVVEKMEAGCTELRVHRAGYKPEDEDSDGEEVDPDGFDRRSGLIDVEGRVQVMVDPAREWAQMLAEVWRHLRDEWWSPDMAFGGEVAASEPGGGADADTPAPRADWPGVLTRYASILPRVAARSELADLFHEMSSELRSSHVSVLSGDPGEVRHRKSHQPGLLGCDVAWDTGAVGYRITHIVRGDAWDEATGGALCKPGVNAAVGDILTHVNRVRLTQAVAPAELLVGKGGAEVMLTFTVGDGPRRPAAESMAGAGGELAARVGAMSLGGGDGGGKNKKVGGGGGKAHSSSKGTAVKGGAGKSGSLNPDVQSDSRQTLNPGS
jgi:hypothetical protein